MGEVCFKQISGFPRVLKEVLSWGDGGQAHALRIQTAWPHHSGFVTEAGAGKSEIRHQGATKRWGMETRPPATLMQGDQEVSRGQKGMHRETTALQTAEHGDLLRTSPTSGPRR